MGVWDSAERIVTVEEADAIGIRLPIWHGTLFAGQQISLSSLCKRSEGKGRRSGRTWNCSSDVTQIRPTTAPSVTERISAAKEQCRPGTRYFSKRFNFQPEMAIRSPSEHSLRMSPDKDVGSARNHALA